MKIWTRLVWAIGLTAGIITIGTFTYISFWPRTPSIELTSVEGTSAESVYSANLSDLTMLPGEDERYPVAVFRISGHVENLGRSDVYLVVNPISPTGGGVWVQHPPAIVGSDGGFTASAQYGVDQQWNGSIYELEVFAIVVSADQDVPNTRLKSLGSTDLLSQSKSVKILIKRSEE